MKIIERKELDIARWDALVASKEQSTFFSQSWYLDATAQHWAVVCDDDFTCGMALPYTVRLGQELLYTPIFLRYLEYFGAPEHLPEMLACVNARFKNIHMNVADAAFSDSGEKRVFQRIDHTAERNISKHAHRMLKKAAKMDWKVEFDEDYKKVSTIVRQELFGRIEGIDEKSEAALTTLMRAAKERGFLRVLTLPNAGSIACLQDDNYCLYLKGTVDKASKTNGGMYLLMNTAISLALEAGQHFDFGGSNAEGVRRFNKALGGSDVDYYTLHADNSPIWFKFAKRIRNTWKKYY